ncbi:MAG: sigma-54 dependent transcriptional regulator [Paracoccaceae bacterium]
MKVLLIDDEEDIRAALTQTLELAGFTVTACARAERALELVNDEFDGVVVSDIRMPRMDGMALLEAIGARDAELPVVLITGNADVALAVAAMRAGAHDFIEKPFEPARLVEIARRAIALRKLTLENRSLRRVLDGDDILATRIKGRSPEIIDLRRQITLLARHDTDVLIEGDTGTGKELVARALHDLSARAAQPFVAVNLASLPAASIESELFGHVAGAFSGALRERRGRFEHARGGTLYLDEIGALPAALQVKLLRVVEERAITPLGANDSVALDVRFLASSNRPLAALESFRRDLLYRINPASLHVPPLAARRGDIPLLFRHFLTLAAARSGLSVPDIAAETLMALSARDWPGNVRELANEAERFVMGLQKTGDTTPLTLAQRMEAFEHAQIAAALSAHHGALRETYESLGLARKSLYEKMQKYGLKREDFGSDQPG